MFFFLFGGRKAPKGIYHCFHICICEECRKRGGRFFSHSQADWDSHLRYVETKYILTFPATG